MAASNSTRPATHGYAGWYPIQEKRARAVIEGFPTAADTVPAMGILVPHAGWRFSGPTANRAFSGVEIPPTALVFGTVHGGLARALNAHGLFGNSIVYWPEGAWETPFGPVPVDPRLAAGLARCPSLTPDPMDSADEHSAEIELPFLKHYRPDIQAVVLHVALGHGNGVFGALERAAAEIAGAFADWDVKPLLVASSDMSHEGSYERTTAQDALAKEAIAAFDPKALVEVVHKRDISMCGVLPAALVMLIARAWGATQAEILGYATSADDAAGRADYVVGYCAARFR